MLVGQPGHARVAGRRMKVGDVRVGRQRPGQRVLAAARAEEKDSHGREPTRGRVPACGGTGRTAGWVGHWGRLQAWMWTWPHPGTLTPGTS